MQSFAFIFARGIFLLLIIQFSLAINCPTYAEVSAEEKTEVFYAWLDEFRLFLVAKAYTPQQIDRKALIERCGFDKNIWSICILDFNVNKPYRGLTVISPLPVEPRLGNNEYQFWLEDICVDFGTGNILAQECFVPKFVEPNFQECQLVDWLLGLEFSGWEKANLYELLYIRSPPEFSTVPIVQYKNTSIDLQRYTGKFEPHWWTGNRSLPSEISNNSEYPLSQSDDTPLSWPLFPAWDIRYAQAIIQRHPMRMEGYMWRATILVREEPKRALEDYSKAIQFAPNSPVARLARAWFYYRHGDNFSAWLDAKEAARYAPDYAEDAIHFFNKDGEFEEKNNRQPQ